MKILVSACLLGENCKYSGGNNYNQAVCDFAYPAERPAAHRQRRDEVG